MNNAIATALSGEEVNIWDLACFARGEEHEPEGVWSNFVGSLKHLPVAVSP